MELTIHRGTKEIGGSMVELKSGESRILIDVGLPLVDENLQPFDRERYRSKSTEELIREGVLPNIQGAFSPGKKLNGILLSHCHLDHVGLLSHTSKNCPVYVSTGTSKMMNASSIFGGQFRLEQERQRPLESGKAIDIGAFRVTPYFVDHSCFGSMAFLVESEGIRILYSGDLRFHGRKPGMLKSLIADVGPLKIDALIMEGTHLGSDRGKRRTEHQLEGEIAEQIGSAKGLVLAAFSPIDVDRLVTYLKATMKTDRIFVADAYTAYVMYLVKSEISIPDPRDADGIRVYFNKAFEQKRMEKLNRLFDARRIRLNEIVDAPERYVMVFRPSMANLDFNGNLPKEVRCVYSYWKGYLEKPDWQELQSHIQDIDGDFITAHTSGHIFVDDLVIFVRSIGAKRVIPIHTFEPNEFSKHFENVVALEDGEVFSLEA